MLNGRSCITGVINNQIEASVICRSINNIIFCKFDMNTLMDITWQWREAQLCRGMHIIDMLSLKFLFFGADSHGKNSENSFLPIISSDNYVIGIPWISEHYWSLDDDFARDFVLFKHICHYVLTSNMIFFFHSKNCSCT